MRDGTRWLVLVDAHGTDRVHTVHLEYRLAAAEVDRLRSHGFEARVAEGRPTASGEIVRRYKGRRA